MLIRLKHNGGIYLDAHATVYAAMKLIEALRNMDLISNDVFERIASEAGCGVDIRPKQCYNQSQQGGD